MEFTYYLFQKDIKSLDDLIALQALPLGYVEVTLQEAFSELEANVIVHAYVREGEPKIDGGWKNFIATHFSVEGDVLATRTPSAIVFIEASDRLFAVPFGFGRYAIPEDMIEQDFGIATSLNRLRGVKLTMVKVVTPGTRKKSTTIERNYEGEVSELTTSRASDILSEVAGKTPHGEGEARISGRQALRFVDAATLQELIENCTTALGWYTAQDPEDDELAALTSAQQIKDEGTISRLVERLHKLMISDGEVDASISDPDWPGLPEITGRELKIGRADWAPVPYEFEMDWFRPYWKAGNFDWNDLREPIINFSLEDGNNIKATPIRLMSAVVLLGTSAFYLEDGRWFRTSAQYVSNVDEFIAKVENIPAGFLPTFDGGVHFITLASGSTRMSEGAYNADVEVKVGHTNCDIPAKRYKQETEVCDLLTANDDLIHLKRGTGFGSVSYVCSQAFVSTDRLCSDDDFRIFTSGLSPSAAWIATAPWDRRKIRVIVGLITKQSKNTAASLSFNGRRILARLSEDCHRLGIRLAYVRVDDVTKP